MSFTHGVADAPLKVIGDCGSKTGTEVSPSRRAGNLHQ
jgi:DNA gyrase subunit B